MSLTLPPPPTRPSQRGDTPDVMIEALANSLGPNRIVAKLNAVAQLCGFAQSEATRRASFDEKAKLAEVAASIRSGRTSADVPSGGIESLLQPQLRPAFRAYVQSSDGIATEARLATLLERYDKDFRSSVDPLLKRALAGGFAAIKGYLGSGVNADAIEICIGGLPVVARIEKRGPIILNNTALLRSEGMDSTPTLLAFSVDPPVQILSRVPGTPLALKSIAQRPVIPAGEISRAIGTVLEFARRDILIDSKPGNLLVTDKGELGFIDYAHRKDIPPEVSVALLFTALSQCYHRSNDPSGVMARLYHDVLKHEVLLAMTIILHDEHRDVLPAFAERIRYKNYFEPPPQSRFPDIRPDHPRIARLNSLREEIGMYY